MKKRILKNLLVLSTLALCFSFVCFSKPSAVAAEKKCHTHSVYGTCPSGHPAVNNYGECDVEECPWYYGREGGGAY